ncbi:hypothetical protein [Kitasatospora paranensis]|jgi:hypothetical protein|uniref:Lipoprotein n=1 Tax=Kitasatospora paranensis TaxID=258053 RepID=A0ABW2G414_9ACTN
MNPVRTALVLAAVCGLLLAGAGSAAACGPLDLAAGLAPGFGNACVNR